jgi:Domain of unknown function (DUF1707)
MAEPGDQIVVTAVGGGHLRASHADREHVIDTLNTAFAAGLLAKEEFDLRVGWAHASRTYADLACVSAGITASPPRSARSLIRAESAAAWGVCGLVVSAILTIVVIPAGTTKGVVVSTAILIYVVSWLLAGITMLATRRRG